VNWQSTQDEGFSRAALDDLCRTGTGRERTLKKVLDRPFKAMLCFRGARHGMPDLNICVKTAFQLAVCVKNKPRSIECDDRLAGSIQRIYPTR
jgi:hypothetical protein